MTRERKREIVKVRNKCHVMAGPMVFYKFGADTQVCPYGLRLNNFVVIISKNGRDRSRMTLMMRIGTDKK